MIEFFEKRPLETLIAGLIISALIAIFTGFILVNLILDFLILWR